MKKKTGIFVILLSVIVSVVMIFTALAGWGSTKRGSMQNIKLGLDLSGGVSITYEADQAAPSIDDMDDTIDELVEEIWN